MFSPSYSSPLCRCRPPSSLLPVGKHPPCSAKGQWTPAWSNHVQRPHCRRQRSLLARGPQDRGEDPEADPREPAPGGEVAPRRAARSGAEPPGRRRPPGGPAHGGGAQAQGRRAEGGAVPPNAGHHLFVVGRIGGSGCQGCSSTLQAAILWTSLALLRMVSEQGAREVPLEAEAEADEQEEVPGGPRRGRCDGPRR